MDKAHDVQRVSFSGMRMFLSVDGEEYEIDIAQQSAKLAAATPEQRARFIVSPSGYGIHWPDLDEDLAVGGLIGVKHSSPVVGASSHS